MTEEEKCQQSQRNGYNLLPFFSPGRTHSCCEAVYTDENKQNQIIPAVWSKDRTVLHHQVREVPSVGSGMKLYGEDCLRGQGVAGKDQFS